MREPTLTWPRPLKTPSQKSPLTIFGLGLLIAVTVPRKTRKCCRLQAIDFSNIQKHGKYLLRIGSVESTPFSIATNAYQTTFISLLRSYYSQRCGVILEDPIPGLYHAPCHQHDHNLAHADTLHQKGDKVNATGGWHDAGDYGKYVATTATTIARILSVYEQHPSLF